MTMLTDGDLAPEFTAEVTPEGEINTQDLTGKGYILYFYPKDNTPGCTTEGKDFRDAYAEFQQENIEIFGVSRDSIRVHNNFKAKHDFPFELISDTDETLCNLYGVIQLKKLYGKEYMGIVRSTFFINRDGVIVKAWQKVRVKGHVEEVLEFIKAYEH